MKHQIDEIYTKPRFLAHVKLLKYSKNEGVNINRKRVQHYMREIGIKAVYPGPNLSKRNLEYRIYPYLLKRVNITRPNQVWSIDITYIRLNQSWTYLTAIID